MEVAHQMGNTDSMLHLQVLKIIVLRLSHLRIDPNCFRPKGRVIFSRFLRTALLMMRYEIRAFFNPDQVCVVTLGFLYFKLYFLIVLIAADVTFPWNTNPHAQIFEGVQAVFLPAVVILPFLPELEEI